MAKRVDFLRLPVKAWQQGDTVAAYRNGKVVRIPIFGESDAPDFPDLAEVATTGKYSDLLNKPTLGTAAAKDSTAFATADQGTKADTAYGWGNHAQAGYLKSHQSLEGYAKKSELFSGEYSDLTGKPSLGSAASKDVSDFATASEGGKGAAAYSWGNHASAGYAVASNVNTSLNGKVDKVAGYGLSQSNFTSSEKAKLAALEGSHYQGLFTSASELPALAVAGDYADVDTGVGDEVARYIWDSSDNEWVQQAGVTSPLTASEIKVLYEQNPDTNVFGDADKSKLTGVAAGATKNATDAQLRARSSHTGTQPVSTVTGLSDAATTSVASIRSGTTAANVGLGSVRNVASYSQTESDSLFELKENLGAAAYTGFGTGASSAARGNHTHANYWDIVSNTGYLSNDSENLDDFSAGELGLIRTSYSNTPYTGGFADIITKSQYGTPDLLQIAFPFRGNGGLHMRNRSSSGWSSWQEYYHSGNFTPTNYYLKSEVDSLIAGATSGSNVWQNATTALIKNAYNKVAFPNPKTLTLPSNPTENDYVAILSVEGDMKDSTIARNGKTIMGLAEDMTIDTKTPYLRLDYVAGSWRIAS